MNIETIRNFLLSPEEMRDPFWDSDELIWIDWREYEESIIEYFNKKLPNTDQIQFECVKSEKKREIDIILKKGSYLTTIPYADDYTDRDTTIKSIQEYLAPKYQIRWYLDSLGSDTLAFCIYTTEDWYKLEEEFGVDKVAYYFASIYKHSVMFEMNIDEVCTLLNQRKEF